MSAKPNSSIALLLKRADLIFTGEENAHQNIPAELRPGATLGQSFTSQAGLRAVGEIEALDALAAYAFERPDDTYPEIVASDPPLFEAYDNWGAVKVEQLRLIEEEAEARRSHPAAMAAQEYIDQMLAKVGGVESRLTNAQRGRLAETREALYSYLREDTPAMAFLRQRMAEADEGLRTLGPKVGAAIRDATEAAHGPEPTVVAPSGVQTAINRLPGGGFEVVLDTPEGVGRLAAVTPEAAAAQEARLRAAYNQRAAIQAAKTDAEAGRHGQLHHAETRRRAAVGRQLRPQQ